MNIIEKVAAAHGTTTEEAREAMEAAIRSAGIELELETFVTLCAARAVSNSVPEVTR